VSNQIGFDAGKADGFDIAAGVGFSTPNRHYLGLQQLVAIVITRDAKTIAADCNATYVSADNARLTRNGNKKTREIGAVD